MSGISRDEWLKALADTVPAPLVDDQDALTPEEFATLFGCCATSARKRLRKLCAEGRVQKTTKIITYTDGRRMPATAYRLIAP